MGIARKLLVIVMSLSLAVGPSAAMASSADNPLAAHTQFARFGGGGA
ncbi:MAG: hypothetical protein NVS2B6_09870 [Thermoleophilaceae bacterium]